MPFSNKVKTAFLILGDWGLFYISLFFALVLRYEELFFERSIWETHQTPFFFIHLLWILIFYINGLYDIKNFSSLKNVLANTLKTMAIAALLAIVIFYLTPGLIIAPKTNLFLDILILTALLILWRRIFWSLARKGSKIKTLFFGSSLEIEKLMEKLKNNPQLGYSPIPVLANFNSNLPELVKTYHAQLVVASKNIINHKKSAQEFYKIIPLGVSITDFESFYESLSEKIPINSINESWFLEHLREINKKNFEKIKRVADITGALVLGIFTIIITPLIFIFSKIESKDRILVKQKRVGKDGKIFTLYKFRSMYHASEPDGKAKWAEKKDPRITKFGKILRKTRIDELPQLWNVFKGELSFIGPRPERPEFVSQLEKEIPYYAIRHIVKPGLSGWAQIKYPYGASVEDAKQKLQFELYYIKNRSLILDLAIAVKTLAIMIGGKGR